MADTSEKPPEPPYKLHFFTPDGDRVARIVGPLKDGLWEVIYKDELSEATSGDEASGPAMDAFFKDRASDSAVDAFLKDEASGPAMDAFLDIYLDRISARAAAEREAMTDLVQRFATTA